MAVYVDDMEADFGRMKMCHMFADSTEELVAMAALIGVSKKWIQKAGHRHEHFDIAKSKRALAVANGAIEVTWRQFGLADRRGPNDKWIFHETITDKRNARLLNFNLLED